MAAIISGEEAEKHRQGCTSYKTKKHTIKETVPVRIGLWLFFFLGLILPFF